MNQPLSTKKKKGQYFTTSESLQQFVFDKVKHKGSLLLEPSFGQGHLLKKFLDSDPNYPMVCYELDSTLQPCVHFNHHQTRIYGDFTTQTISQKFKTIIGNPPYIKQSKGNLYIRFIEQCFELLEPNGELIFIVPSDCFKMTHAAPIVQTMAQQGSFTEFLFPHDEKLFEGASIDVVVFRYEKDLHSQDCRVNGEPKIWTVQNGILTFSQTQPNGVPLNSLFDVYVGLVSGRDELYRVPFGNLKVLCDKDKIESFIFTDIFPTDNTQINAHLRANKQVLLERRIRKFDEQNWFEWGAPRNLKSIEANLGRPCLYVRTVTRQKEVCFAGTVQHFGGALLCLVPKASMTPHDLKKVMDFLNQDTFQKEYLYSGRFKIGHKQLSNVLLPT